MIESTIPRTGDGRLNADLRPRRPRERPSDDRPEGPAILRAESGDYSCPHCGLHAASKTARWDHVSACPHNPNPACRWCERHYSMRELPRHEARCAMRREAPAQRGRTHEQRAPLRAVEGSDADDDGEAGVHPLRHDLGDDGADEDHGDTRGASSRELKPDATDTDARGALAGLIAHHPEALAPEVVPLDPFLSDVAIYAPLWPTIGSGILADSWDKLAVKVRKSLTPEQQRSFDAQAAAMSPETKSLLGTLHEQQQNRTREQAMNALFIGILVLAVIAFLAWLASKNKRSAQATTTSPAVVQYRPLYNPAIWPSVEHYRADVGHLPIPPHVPDVAGDTVGLDRTKRPGW